MRLSASIFLPLFVTALLVDAALATSDKACNAVRKHSKHHPHKAHEQHHKHHSKHHNHQQGGNRQDAEEKPGSKDQSQQDKATNYDENGSYSGSTSQPINIGAGNSSHHGHSSSNKGSGKSPFRCKAGIGGTEALDLLRDAIGWAHTWEPHPFAGNNMGKVTFASTLYGIGQTGRAQDVAAWNAFQKMPAGKWTVYIGYNEADYHGKASSGLIPTEVAAQKWDQVMRAHKEKGGILISPSCAKQLDEDWMGPFLNAVEVKPDYVNIHVFSDDAEFILEVLTHYRKYGYAMVVTEFACINFTKNKKCNQEETIAFIYRAVEIFENAPDVHGYSIADADNGDFSHLTKDGKLTKTGWAYQDAISKHSKRDKVYKKREAPAVLPLMMASS